MLDIVRNEQHRDLLGHWLKSLANVSGVDLVWLEGSLVDNPKPNPAADIDIRFGIADGLFDRLWTEVPEELLSGLGDYLPLNGNWRLLTATGIVVEIMAFRLSDLDGKEVNEWEILYSREPERAPSFRKMPARHPCETWPHPEKLDREKVEELTKMFLHYGATAPAPLHSGEMQAARFSLELIRAELMKLLFRRAGVWFFKRYKHLSEVLPAEFLADLDGTYYQSGSSPLDPRTVAMETIKTLEKVGKHLRAMSDQVGGGFEPEWYEMMLSSVREQLHPFVTEEAAGV